MIKRLFRRKETLRESRILLPIAGNDGEPIDNAHAGLVADLSSAFGGVSRSIIDGTWIGPDGKVYAESCYAYDCATIDNRDARAKVRAYALARAREAHQLAVYVRHGNGSVDIIDVD